MIYFVQSPDGGPVKIGHSTNIDVRIKQLRFQFGTPLVLLATMEGGRPEEQALHARFAAHRLGSTEQFRPVAEIMNFIGRPLLVGVDPEAVEPMPVKSGHYQFRFTDEEVAQMDALARHLGKQMGIKLSRTDVLRMALNAMAERVLGKGAPR